MFLHEATIQEMIIIDPFNFNFNLATMNLTTTTLYISPYLYEVAWSSNMLVVECIHMKSPK
jgi:hypothetical protein